MRLAFEDAETTEPEEAAGLPPLLAVKLWQNPCWLSFRVNVIAAGFNRHVYPEITPGVSSTAMKGGGWRGRREASWRTRCTGSFAS